MMSESVVIRKQKIKITTVNEQLANRMHKQLNDSLQRDLMTMMEKTFNLLGPIEGYLNIDKIKIDLTAVSIQDFEKQFVNLVEQKLLIELKRQISDKPEFINHKTQREADTGYYFFQSAPYNSTENQEFDALFYFLGKGTFPWWYKKESRKSPAQLLEALSDEELGNLLNRIIEFRTRSIDGELERICNRIFIHLSESKYESLLKKLIKKTNIDRRVEFLLINRDLILKVFFVPVKEFYFYLFQRILKASVLNQGNIVSLFIKKVNESKKLSIEEIIEKLSVGEGDNIFTDSAGISDEFGNENSEIRKVEGASSKEIAANVGDEVYIENAGLVILHPFLQSYFSKAGLLDDNAQFISVQAKHKAAVLLYYLQCGEVNYKEWEMPLNKIICGLKYSDVIEEGIIISDTERYETRILLETVITYWDALKGASVEAVQNTFIMREGKITQKEDHWLVQVERSAVDILLERLPWGYGIIKFPWLDKLIYTE